MWQHRPAEHAHRRAPWTTIVIALIAVIGASLGAPAHAQSAPPEEVGSTDAACELAFRMAAQAGPAPSATSSAVSEAALASPAVGIPVVSPWSVDATIRACQSLAAWATAAGRYPDVLAGRDGLSLLLERCTDPASGLGVAPACVALDSRVMPSSSPSPSPTPSATVSPPPDPTPTPRPGAEARLVRLPRFDARVKGADRVRTFAIRGSSPEELLRAMQVEAAAVCPQHASACTQTQPRIRPRIATNPLTGSCRVTGLQLSTDDTVHIPRWAGPKRVYPELVAWWRKVNAHVRWHEAQHIRITKRHLATLRKRIVGKPCERINLEVQRVSQQAMQDHQAFDLRDQGWLPSYDGPRP